MGGFAFGIAPPDLLGSGKALSQVITNTTSETAWNFLDIVVPAGGMKAPGSVLRVKQSGVYQGGLAQNIRPRIRMGPAATAMSSRQLIATTPAAVSGLLQSSSDTPWAAETTHITMSDGSIMSTGTLFFSTSATAALTALVAQRSPYTGVNLDIDNVVSASVEWGQALTANQIVCSTFSVELLRP